MSTGKANSPVIAAIEGLLLAQDTVTSGDVARAGHVSRQAAHYQLAAMAARGELDHEGAGRGSRYRRRAFLSYRYDLAGLTEDEVWFAERAELRRRDLKILDNARIQPMLNFTFTEMVNNAIDHSLGSELNVKWFLTEDYIAFEVADDGIGAFRNMATTRHLPTEYDAIGEISKGKQTTAPEAHSGLGIYFTSRMSNRFVLTSGQLSWIVDNRRDDMAVEWLETERRGTLVRCEFDADTTMTDRDAFQAITSPLRPGIQRSTVRVSLFQRGANFVSRTEAKRLASELEGFGEVEIDFTGVKQVGQGFIDELFRVWQTAHPETRLQGTNTNPAIDALLRTTLTS
jgi:STAS-like domain of unknown function (DUF4325)